MFSDERCGPDAEVVKRDYSKPKRPPPKGTSAKPVKTRRPASELEQLMLECDGGDMKACTAWTMGGGPELLRDKERKSEQECEEGSLAACEERYCREGIDAGLPRPRAAYCAAGRRDLVHACRRRAMQRRASRSTSCVAFRPGAQQANDIVVTCSSLAGPNRCYFADPQRGFPRLAAAAVSQCSRAPAAPRDN